jgi:hypothetical protein
MLDAAVTLLFVTVKEVSVSAARVELTVVITPFSLFSVTPVVMLVACVTVPLSERMLTHRLRQQ